MSKAPIRTLTLFSLLFAAGSSFSQSSDQMFPTPVRTAEIVGAIKARAVGDPRLTTYYYTFEGDQGDVFINVQSKNFTGDIDVYIVPSQQPLTKIVIYGDQPEAETGRVIYLRKPERLLLRVQGRSPGDDDASVRIKFAGSFAVSKLDDSATPDVPRVDSASDANVRVNAVGTILEVVPKSTPTVIEERVDDRSSSAVDAKNDDEAVTKRPTPVEVVITDREKTEEKPKVETPRRTIARDRRTRPAAAPKTVEPEVSKEAANAEVPLRRSVRQRPAAEKVVEEAKVDPMANIRLVIYFKDGSTVDRPMTEVQRFSVERAVLTVISKSGAIGRYNMTEVTRVAIE